MSVELPFELFKKNKITQAWDQYVLEAYKNNRNFNDIIDGHETLKEMPTPRSRKEVAKVILASGQEPALFAQRFNSKQVMGDVGEAITELLLPSEQLSVNFSGADVIYQEALIEVKSTASDRVSMSGVQFKNADYLLIHRYHGKKGNYLWSYLIPMKLAKLVKHPANQDRNVTFNIDKENWIEKFGISPLRIVDYFRLRGAYLGLENIIHINQILNPGFHIRNFKLYKSIFKDQGCLEVDSLFVMYRDCECWKWEHRFAYYQYSFSNLFGSFSWHFNKESVARLPSIGFKPILVDNMWQRCI
ncbi:hypothetical protein UB37_19930 [Photobacterium iliopiscarium]|uniref:Restriction endonuclease n=1 Tax=Photobacterium iliopiscarium TaxID=56192 RepID=A0ABX5GMW7_9GAMM|nr:hypothetical protein [Photobacterium iliopiscarium]KJG16631.1 hypothetical protein UB37_19930 [Photobacterium iliopiscarium]PSW92301.1 hypothetical protein C9J52_18930 [Photobacterium iliopiscarium]